MYPKQLKTIMWRKLLGISSPKEKMEKEYSQLLEKAMMAQRNGDLKTYAQLTEQAEKLAAAIQNEQS
jgi:hypothetical protein